jgi:hypothetical protein
VGKGRGRRTTGGRSITHESPLYVLYVLWNNRYEIICIEDALQSAIASATDIVPNMNEPPPDVIRQVKNNMFIQTIVPDGTDQPTDLRRINPDEHDGTISYEWQREKDDPNYRMPVPRPVVFSLRDDGLIHRIDYNGGEMFDNLDVRVLERTPMEQSRGLMFKMTFDY